MQYYTAVLRSFVIALFRRVTRNSQMKVSTVMFVGGNSVNKILPQRNLKLNAAYSWVYIVSEHFCVDLQWQWGLQWWKQCIPCLITFLIWRVLYGTLALVYKQARKGSVLVAGNFNVTADICLSQHRKTKKELKEEQKCKKSIFPSDSKFWHCT